MYKNVLQSIEGIDIYAIISLMIFFLFFIGLAIWVLKVDKKYLRKMESLPLDSQSEKNIIGELDGK